jgi:hypothetical protein
MIYTYQRGAGAPRLHASAVALLAAMLATLAACHTPSPRVSLPDRALPPPKMHEADDGSYDWHGLLIAPFGSVLKDIPVPLHEVLLFRDEAHSTATADDAATVEAECYAADAPAPRLIGRLPDVYLLCFKHDRLSRIQASVRLGGAQASDVFAAACADWLKNAAPATPNAAAPNAEAPNAEAPNAPAPNAPAPNAAAPNAAAPNDPAPNAAAPNAAAPIGAACEGRDGDIHFRGRLEEEPETALFLTLDSPSDP